MANKKITVYVDGVDWQHEIGEAADGNKIYPSINSIKKYNSCSDSCGVVKCELVYKEWVIPQDLQRGMVSAAELDWEDNEANPNFEDIKSLKQKKDELYSELRKISNKIDNYRRSNHENK